TDRRAPTGVFFPLPLEGGRHGGRHVQRTY
ncbi:unnamed protein product, partial [marine sediment metagenome]